MIRKSWFFSNAPYQKMMAMAPMIDVTDYAYRQLVSLKSKRAILDNHIANKSDSKSTFITWSEFVSVNALVYNKDRIVNNELKFHNIQRPIVAQLFGNEPEHFKIAAQAVKEMGYDAIDINMGCPVRKVLKQSAGSALILQPQLARDIISATREGVEGQLPVFVKTRIGFDQVDIDHWIPQLLDGHPDALSVHLRTKKELSDYDAHWELMPRILDLRESFKSNNNNNSQFTTRPFILGNGDIESLVDAQSKLNDNPLLDGVMIGRGVYGNPWFFSNINNINNNNNFNNNTDINNLIITRLTTIIEHALLLEQNQKRLTSISQHLKKYCSPLSPYLHDIGKLRTSLANTLTHQHTSNDLIQLINQYLSTSLELQPIQLDLHTIEFNLNNQIRQLELDLK